MRSCSEFRPSCRKDSASSLVSFLFSATQRPPPLVQLQNCGHCSQIRPHCLSHHLTQCHRRRRRCSAAERRGAHRSRAYRYGQPLCLSLSVQSRWRRPNLDPSSSALPAVAALNTRSKHINLRCNQNQRHKYRPPPRRRLGQNRTRGSCCPCLPYELRRN